MPTFGSGMRGTPHTCVFLSRFPRLQRLALNEPLGIHPLPTLSNAHIVSACPFAPLRQLRRFDGHAQLLGSDQSVGSAHTTSK